MSVELHDPSAAQFSAARDAYREARNAQRLKIVDALRAVGFEVKTRGNAGRGLKRYTSGSRLNPPFDLSGWMWVEGQRGEIHVSVSLQVLDQDPNSLNVHALMDRVGVAVFRANAPIDESDPLLERATTGLQLPLDSRDLVALLALIEERTASQP